MGLLTDNTIAYLKQQKEAGIKLFQLFDTWAGNLRREDYEAFVLPYVQKIFKAIKLPSIYYLKELFSFDGPDGKKRAEMLSVCETVNIKDIKTKKAFRESSK